ncbi:hypothetical protein sos41_39160 [Alphaproteobacteria bacterium SO-S41]|nr:hypothetical protein sos41_39160 [Alphaproteobacteria bacterium SO-S41]
MPRTYRPTGRPPGAPRGNTNALKHGFYGAAGLAERRRARSLFATVMQLAKGGGGGPKNSQTTPPRQDEH